MSRTMVAEATPRAQSIALPGWLGPAALLLVLLLPLAATDIPPLADYPNHLARMWLIAGIGEGDPDAMRLAEAHWALVPNLIMDLVVPPLVWLGLPLDVAGRLFLGVTMVLPVLGTVALHRAWFGGTSPWPWIACLMATSAPLFYGLVNYVAGVGVALLGAAWAARAPRGGVAGLAVAALWGTLALLCHVMALGLMLLLVASPVLWRRGAGWARPAALLAAMGGVPAALLLLFGPSDSYASSVTPMTILAEFLDTGLFQGLLQRIAWIAGPVAAATEHGLPLLTLASLPLPAIVVLAARWGGGRLGIAWQAAPALAVLVLGYLLLPDTLAENGMMYKRLALPIGLLAVAALHPRLADPRAARVAAAAVLVLLGARTAALAADWRDQNRLLADIRAVLGPVEPGARVLAVRDGSGIYTTEADERGAQRMLRQTIAYMHLPALVTIEHGAAWPLLFATPGKQAVTLRPPYDTLHQRDGALPLTGQLDAAADRPPPAGLCSATREDWIAPPCQAWGWPRRYDYVLRLNRGAWEPEAPHLALLASSGFAALYRVER